MTEAHAHRSAGSGAQAAGCPWRFGGGFPPRLLAAELAAVPARARTAPASEKDARWSEGWFRHHSRALIAREAPGLPARGGAFVRARVLLSAYAFSDPRIVEAHFDPDVPLLGRPMLLECKAMGLHYLCGVVVERVRDERNQENSVFGYRYDTRAGHIEAGSEWFLLVKDHDSGDVHFRIEARWRPGDFPNWWSALGFALVGRRAQRAWHRLAHLRMRWLLGSRDLPPLVGAGRIVHQGPYLPTPAVRRVARERPPEIAVETSSPGGDIMPRLSSHPNTRWWECAGLGAVAGLRSMLAPALVARWLRSRPARRRRARVARWLSARAVARVLPVMAAGEIVADKLPGMPARVAPLPLLARASTGALLGLAMARPGHGRRAAAAVAGGVGAVAAAFVGYSLRRAAARRGPPLPLLVALGEDGFAYAVGRTLLARIR